MTTNKPGSVNQQPLYGCTSCYEYYTWPAWPAEDLRVYDNECWCESCWDERRCKFPDQPGWNDLEPYTPAPDVSTLVEALEDIGASWHGEGYMRNVARRALAAYRKGGGE